MGRQTAKKKKKTISTFILIYPILTSTEYSTADQHIFTKVGNSINDNRQTGWADTHTSDHDMNYALGSNWTISEKHSYLLSETFTEYVFLIN